MSRNRIVELLDKLNDCTLPTSRSPDKGNMRSRFDGEIKVSQHLYSWAGGLAEVHGLQINATLSLGDHLPLCGLGVDVRGRAMISDHAIWDWEISGTCKKTLPA